MPLSVRYASWILLCLSFLLVGFPEQILRSVAHPTPINLSGFVIAGVVFALFLFGKNPLDRWLG